MSVTATDLFCGAGGSSLGFELAGGQLRLGLNHWRRAIETHSANFEHADHDCEDIASLTTAQIRRYPDSDILLASPQLFATWRQALAALGYEHEVVWLNSMFLPPTPQSRDRMYVVCWRRGMRAPDLRFEPVAWCPHCERVTHGRQAWKRPDRPAWGRYGPQYLYVCPDCHRPVLPGATPAATAIDWSLEAQRIGDRGKPLANATRERISRGLERLAREPFAIRLMAGGAPRPLTLPLVTMTARHDMAMVMPVAGNTYERTPGNRARDADRQPLDTVNGTLDRALVVPPMGGVDARDAQTAPLPTQTTTTRAAIVHCRGVAELQRHGDVRPAWEPVHTVCAGGHHHALVMANTENHVPKDAEISPTPGVEARVADVEPTTTLTTRDRCALVLTDEQIDDCRFRMFALHEIAHAMAMATHVDGGEYVVRGNKRERMAQYGNAVTPPVMQWIVSRLLPILDEVPA